MPRPLSADLARDIEVAREQKIQKIQKMRKRAEVARMRDVTKSVSDSPALPGDRTNNGADMRKPQKSRDNLARHAPNSAYVLSDTTVYDGDRVVAIRRSSSKLIVRNADGTPNDADTLALASAWNTHRASTSRKGQ